MLAADCIAHYFPIFLIGLFFPLKPLWMLDSKDISAEEHEVCWKKENKF